MKRLLVFCLLLAGCCPCKHLATSTQDSMRVEVIERVEYISDTIEVAIPFERESVIRDTTSHLENDYAKSDAAILADGRLYHSLETIPQLKPFSVQIPQIKRDSIVHHNIYREVVVEVNKLTKFQQFQVDGFWFMLVICSIYLFIRWVIGRL